MAQNKAIGSLGVMAASGAANAAHQLLVRDPSAATNARTQSARFDVLMGALARLTNAFLVADPNFASVQAAFTAASSAGGGVILFKPGTTYNITSDVSAPGNVIVMAQGANFTAGSQSATTGGLFHFTGSVGTAYSLTGNTTEGALTCTVSSSDGANFTAGDHCWLHDTTAISGTDYKRERNVVTSVASGTITFRYPLNFAYLTAASATLTKVTPVENVQWIGGSFDLTGTTGEYDAIQCNWGYNVEVRGIRATKFTGKAVQFWDGLNCHAKRVTALRPTDVSAGHGYGTQLIYCRHSSVEDTYAENCRHTDDVSGGSDITVARSKAVSDSGIMTAGVFTHGLYAKRVNILSPNISGADQGVACGTSTFDGDFDVSIVDPQLNRCSDAIAFTTPTRAKVRGGNIFNSVVRAIAVTGGTDIDIEGPTIDGILTNPSNFGAIDISSSADRVRIRSPRIRNALFNSIRLSGSGEHTLENVDINQVAAAKAINGASLTGKITIRGGVVRQATTSTAVDLTCTGGTARVVVDGLTSEGTGGTAAAAGVKVTGAALFTARDVTTANVSEGVRGDDCTAMQVDSSYLAVDTNGNCIKAGGTTATLYLGRNTYVGSGNLPVSNTANAVISGVDPAGIKAVTTTYTQTQNDGTILGNATGGAFTVTLLSAARMIGQRVTIKKTDASANAVTIDGNSAETIDGAATVALSTQYAFRTIQSDGSNWHVISS